MNDLFYDLYRITGRKDGFAFITTFFRQRSFRYICYFRARQKSRLLGFFVSPFSYLLNRKMSVEIPLSVRIGRGFLMIHPYGITMNSKTVVGSNFTILKGATIGNTKSGKTPGCPLIGDNVYVGLNSTIVGGVHIGDNVMIAANTFVNFDVPEDSVVIGSPGVIHHKEKASEPYINHSISEFNID